MEPTPGGRDLGVQTQNWFEETESNADPLPSGGQTGARWVGQGSKGQVGRALARKYLAQPLFCLPRELLGDPQAWHLLLASCLVLGVLQLAFLPLLPESPRYFLIDCGDMEACLAGESLCSQTTLDKWAHLSRACESPLLGFHLSGESCPSFFDNPSLQNYLPRGCPECQGSGIEQT